MILGLVFLSLAGLMLWRGFTGQSPIEEIMKLTSGEAAFVRNPGSRSGTGEPVSNPENIAPVEVDRPGDSDSFRGQPPQTGRGNLIE